MKQKHKMRTAEEKAELIKGFLAAQNKRDYGKSVGISESMIRKWAQAIDPKLRAANTASANITKQIPSVKINTKPWFTDADFREVTTDMEFDKHEHQMIMFACSAARFTLDSILYKLKRMDRESPEAR